MPLGGVPGTVSTWSPDLSWSDGGKGGVPEVVTREGMSKSYLREGSQVENVLSRKNNC